MSYLPASGNISLSSIRSIMNGGNSLSSYRNAYFFTSANSYGRLPSSTIRFSDFYAKGKRANVATGQYLMYGNGSTTIGVVNTLNIDIAGAGGGGAGANGNYSSGAPGGNGGATTFITPIGTLTGPGGVESLYNLNAKNVAIEAMNRGYRYSDRLQVPLFKNEWGT